MAMVPDTFGIRILGANGTIRFRLQSSNLFQSIQDRFALDFVAGFSLGGSCQRNVYMLVSAVHMSDIRIDSMQ